MLDIDDFKLINDSLGHSMGDAVLKAFSQKLAETFGESCCYRYGGDEFAVVAPLEDDAEMRRRLESLAASLEDLNIPGLEQKVCFSAGYVYGRTEFSYGLRYMMHQADATLYEAKGSGKNRSIGRPYSRSPAETLISNPHYAGRHHDAAFERRAG